MPKTMYCWRCKLDIPMLTEEEWEIISPLMNSSAKLNKQDEKERHASLFNTHNSGTSDQPALEMYEKITGFKEINVNAIWHHRASMFGPPCRNCAKPLRTPKANFCAECGTTKSTSV